MLNFNKIQTLSRRKSLQKRKSRDFKDFRGYYKAMKSRATRSRWRRSCLDGSRKGNQRVFVRTKVSQLASSLAVSFSPASVRTPGGRFPLAEIWRTRSLRLWFVEPYSLLSSSVDLAGSTRRVTEKEHVLEGMRKIGQRQIAVSASLKALSWAELNVKKAILPECTAVRPR